VSPSPRLHTTAIQVRFSDTDALGHVNNTSYAAYAELARYDFFAAVGHEARSLILANLSIDFRAQVRMGAVVTVETTVTRLGTSSITLQHHILADGALAAETSSVVVTFDYANNRSTPMTDRLREALEAYRHPTE
jgi:acyl-CoA thioester hydrolase